MKKAGSSAILLLVLTLVASTAAAAPPGQGPEGEVYIVQKDDWLSKIAEKYYGDIFAYPIIVDATNARAAEDDSFGPIPDPDVIEIGQKLWIPHLSPDSSWGGNLKLEMLQNATYGGIYDEAVQLTDGYFEGKPFVEGGASRPTVMLIDRFNFFGDLDGDGVEDAAVILAENSGGSGVFIYLAAMVSQDGALVNVATQLLGDRLQVDSVVIDSGQIVVTGVTHGPDDPMCCPTLEMTAQYQLQGDTLVEQEFLPASSIFEGRYKARLPAASSPGRDVTLTLNADGTVELSTDYLNGEAPIVEIGTWNADADGTASVALTGRAEGLVYEAPVVIVFQLMKGELVAVEYDVSLYGSEGLRLARQ